MSEKIEPVAFGQVTGYLPDKRSVEIRLAGEVPEWVKSLPCNAYLTSRADLDAVGLEGRGHNADWCAGWNAKNLVEAQSAATVSALEARVKAALAVVEKMDIAASADRKDSIKPPRLGGAELTSSEYSNLANIQDHWAKMLRQALTGAANG